MSEHEQVKLALIENINAVHQKMSEIVLYNGIKKTTWQGMIEDLIKRRMSEVELVYMFLSEFHETLWKEAHAIWTQTNLTSEMWHNYKLFFDKAQLVEQKQMLVVAKKMRERWRRFRDQLAEHKRLAVLEERNETPEAPKQETT